MFNPFKKNIFLIAVLGPDGSGKSTLINNLMIKYSNLANNYYSHLYPNSKSSLNLDSKSRVLYPYSGKPYPSYLSIAKIIYMLIKNFFSYIIILFKNNPSIQDIIWCDRYLYDIFSDPLRYRISKIFFNFKFLKKFIIKPNLIIIINPPVKVILKRSKELSYKELNKLNKSYDKLHKFLPEALLISSESSFEDVVELCEKKINKFIHTVK